MTGHSHIRPQQASVERPPSHPLDRTDDPFARQTAEITAALRGEISAAMARRTRDLVSAIVSVLAAVGVLMAVVLSLR